MTDVQTAEMHNGPCGGETEKLGQSLTHACPTRKPEPQF